MLLQNNTHIFRCLSILSTCLSSHVCMYVCSSICVSDVVLHVCPSFCPSVRPCVCASVCMYVCVSVRLSDIDRGARFDEAFPQIDVHAWAAIFMRARGVDSSFVQYNVKRPPGSLYVQHTLWQIVYMYLDIKCQFVRWSVHQSACSYVCQLASRSVRWSVHQSWSRYVCQSASRS